MRKRLLFALAAMCVPQGRFQITEANVASSDFSNLNGWTVVSATDGQTLDAVFETVQEEGTGLWYAKSLIATAGEGMYFKFEPTDQSATYVVSFKMKGVVGATIRTTNAVIGSNNVIVQGNSDNTFGGATNAVICNKAEELTEDWQTFNYAIVPDENNTARTYYISFTGMETTAEIADLQIAPALQYADLRQRDAMVEKMEAYRNVYNWNQDILDDMGYDEHLEALKAIDDVKGQAELDEELNTCKEILNDFIKANMDDILAGNAQNYLPMGAKISGGSAGQWTSTTRVYRSANYYYDFGHYVAGGTWMNNAPTQPMGVYMVKNLTKGSYVFSIDAAAAVREGTSSSGTGAWDDNKGLRVGYAVLYIKKAAEGDHVNVTKDDAESCLAFKTYDVSPVPGDSFTPGLITAQITEDGDYEFGIMVYCKEQYQSRKNGSVTYLYDAQMWGKNDNKYNVAQLSYETDVREQITTGRNALTKAAEYIASEDYLWGKAALQDSIAKFEPLIAGYEAYTQEQIIETFDESYVKDNRTKTAEEGLLVYEVYDTAVRGILDANKKFLAVNDTLNSMQTIIDAAEATLALRIYDAATGKEALKRSSYCGR